MAQENEIQVRISAETSDLKPGMESAASDVERSSDRMKQSIAGLKDAVSSHMSTISNHVKAANDDIGGGLSGMAGMFGKVGGLIGTAFAAIAGGKMVQMANETADYTEEAQKLGRAMGTTATQASIWMEVAKELGSSTGEVEGAAKGLTRQLKDNEDGLNRLGLVTRDSKGNMLDMDTLMKSAITTVNSHKEGTDRNMAAQEIFGRGVAGNSKLLLANAEAFKQDEEYIRSLGGQVSGESVAAWELYDSAMDKVGMGMTAFRNTIGNEVMPVIAKLAEWLSAAMPAAITVTKGAVGGLVSAFWGLKNGVVVVWETINAMVVTVAEPIRAMAAAIGKALTGDFAGAAAEIKGVGGNISAAWSQAMDEMTKSSEETSQRIGAIFGAPTDVEAGDKSGKGYVGEPDKPKKEKAGSGEKTRMPAWEAELAQQKAAFMLQNDMYEMTLEQEKKFWDEKLALVEKNDKEYGALTKKSADMALKILKDKAVEGRAFAQMDIDEWKRAASSGIEVQEQAADLAYSLGQISNDERLQLDRQFEQQRYEIAAQAIEERMTLMSKDPNMSAVEYQKLKNQLLEIDRKHMMDKRAIDGKIDVAQAMPAKNMFAAMENSFSGALTGMLTRAQTWRQGLNSIFQSMTNAFISEFVVKRGIAFAGELLKETALYRTFFATKQGLDAAGAAVHSGTETAKTAATLAGVTTRTTAETAASGQSVMMRLGSAISSIMISAWEAMAGAFAAMASIPYVGPILAVGAGAAAFAAVAGIVGSLPSAAGGYDIPAGINPIVQTHSAEMILPEKHANVIRSMADEGGGGGRTVHVHNHIQAWDSRDVKRFLIGNKAGLVAALKEAQRTGNV
ncbi:hypothetical protein KI608_18015 [Ferribacterium limneticum]|nr:hypothetical protein [Ferribacterium limneticum]UCV32029.1 hypothetical protein KI608_18015 [Ferribacterium limneticum]